MAFPNPWGTQRIPESHRQYVQCFSNFIGYTNFIQVPTNNNIALPIHRHRKNKFPTQQQDDRKTRRKRKRNIGYGIGRSKEGVYMIINNIPKDFRSIDLRSFFSQFVETSGFVCFNYIHRPEIQIPSTTEQSPESDQSKCATTFCCMIKVDTERASEFLESYNGVQWVDNDGLTRMSRCFIKNIVIDHSGSHEGFEPQKKKAISYKIRTDCDRFSYEYLNRMGELRPPSYMPYGNVGTKLNQLQEENNAGRLPPKIIRKLCLESPGTEGNYHRGQELVDEWDNYNARHNDVTEQEGTIGMDYDKGAKNPVGMQVKEDMRDRGKNEVDHLREFAAFEKYSNGFGRKLMESLGWKEGQGIGKNCSGMSEPLMNDGQKPTDKKGFGFHHKKLGKKTHPKKIQNDSDKSEIPLLVSTNSNSQVSGSQDSDFVYTSDTKPKYQREFVKGQEDVNNKRNPSLSQ